MIEPGYWPFVLVGLLGGTHCIGMCGGIVAALGTGRFSWSTHLAYNLGRVCSYTLAGAAVGTLGGAGMALAGQWPLRLLLYSLANLMLIALGLYLLGMTRVLQPVERAGKRLWVKIAPWGKAYMPAKGFRQAFPLGLVWGWLPCGLVYSTLSSAVVAGSATRGALIMLAFGAGTLPNLLLAGVFAARLRAWSHRREVRWFAGILVMGYGFWGLAHLLLH